ncbi:hypothetical protein [Limnoglobus roseus]|uniref:Uncharacterized protein n=1 Tax=Limnoglobus roseus TaxID=2598579 RepID=A0A5C1AF25_9BACT|nr:hypothetical protein [Limnoglobus roseus]QEL17155.1 hypothetical protein PX52LOC_04136 [Limnoglobus roseus]
MPALIYCVPGYVPAVPNSPRWGEAGGYAATEAWLAALPLPDALWRSAVLFQARRLGDLVAARYADFAFLARGLALVGADDPAAVNPVRAELAAAENAWDAMLETIFRTCDADDLEAARPEVPHYSLASNVAGVLHHALAVSLAVDRGAAVPDAARVFHTSLLVQAAVLRERGLADAPSSYYAKKEQPRAVTLFRPIPGWKEEWATPTVRRLAEGVYANPRGGLAPALAKALQTAGCGVGWVMRFLAEPRQGVNLHPSLWVVSKLAGRPAFDYRPPKGVPVTPAAASAPSPAPKTHSRPVSGRRLPF